MLRYARGRSLIALSLMYCMSVKSIIDVHDRGAWLSSIFNVHVQQKIGVCCADSMAKDHSWLLRKPKSGPSNTFEGCHF